MTHVFFGPRKSESKTKINMTELKNLRDNISSTGSMSALDLFYINRETVVSMISFGATYVVILFQFRVGEI